MRGGEVALLDAAMPGTVTRRATGAGAVQPPCPTCPGARSGPGGASAFNVPAPAAPVTTARGRGVAGAAPGAGGGRGNAPGTRLRREPALVALAADDAGDLGRRATALLARLEWPAKPGAAAPVAPLTVDEEKRFEAGQEIYTNICRACHQPDGRGQDKVAPPLVGSAFALAALPAIPARILMNGKEGPVGLMPPLGAALSDDQIAAVLTYVRREWGHTASPVAPTMVRAARAEVAGRTRPWTNDELTALMAADGGR